MEILGLLVMVLGFVIGVGGALMAHATALRFVIVIVGLAITYYGLHGILIKMHKKKMFPDME